MRRQRQLVNDIAPINNIENIGQTLLANENITMDAE